MQPASGIQTPLNLSGYQTDNLEASLNLPDQNSSQQQRQQQNADLLDIFGWSYLKVLVL